MVRGDGFTGEGRNIVHIRHRQSPMRAASKSSIAAMEEAAAARTGRAVPHFPHPSSAGDAETYARSVFRRQGEQGVHRRGRRRHAQRGRQRPCRSRRPARSGWSPLGTGNDFAARRADPARHPRARPHSGAARRSPSTTSNAADPPQHQHCRERGSTWRSCAAARACATAPTRGSISAVSSRRSRTTAEQGTRLTVTTGGETREYFRAHRRRVQRQTASAAAFRICPVADADGRAGSSSSSWTVPNARRRIPCPSCIRLMRGKTPAASRSPTIFPVRRRTISSPDGPIFVQYDGEIGAGARRSTRASCERKTQNVPRVT